MTDRNCAEAEVIVATEFEITCGSNTSTFDLTAALVKPDALKASKA